MQSEASSTGRVSQHVFVPKQGKLDHKRKILEQFPQLEGKSPFFIVKSRFISCERYQSVLRVGCLSEMFQKEDSFIDGYGPLQ